MGGFSHPLCRLFSMFLLPSATSRGLACAWHVLWPGALFLWAIAVIGCCRGWDWRSMSLIHDAAVATVILAGQCRHAARQYDEDVKALIRQNDDLYERIPEDLRPPLMRAAAGR